MDVFTRCRGGATHEVREIAPGIQVVSAKAAVPPDPQVRRPALPPEFLGGVPRVAKENGNATT